MAGQRCRRLDNNRLPALAERVPPLSLGCRRLHRLESADVLDEETPAARAVNVLLTRQCVTFVIVMTRHTPDPGDPDEPLLAWFNAAVDEHKHDIATMIEGLGDADWGLPASRRWAARRLVRMWERGGAEAFRDLSVSLTHKPVLP